MAAKSVTHSVSLAVGDISLALSDSQTADADPTDYVMGVQRVGTTAEYLGRADKADALGDVDTTACNVLLLLRNDNAVGAGSGELKVTLDDDDPAASTHADIIIKPQQINLISIDALQDVRLCSHSGNCDFTYLAIQIGSGA